MGDRRAHDVRPYAGNGRRLHPVGSDAPIGTQKAPCPIGDRALMVEKGRSPLLAEVVQAQGGGLSAALPLADGGDHQHDSGDQEGEGLEEVGGDAVEPAQSVRECAGQRAGVDLKGVEEAKDQGAQDGICKTCSSCSPYQPSFSLSVTLAGTII